MRSLSTSLPVSLVRFAEASLRNSLSLGDTLLSDDLVPSNASTTTCDDAGGGFARAGVDLLAKPRPPTPTPDPAPDPGSAPSFWRLVRPPPAPSPGFLI